MLFNSFIFIFIFFPVVITGYILLNRFRFFFYAKLWLVLSSLLFCAYGSVSAIPVMLLSIIVNYLIGSFLRRHSIDSDYKNTTVKIILSLGIFFNVSLLSVFKYADFFVLGINKIADTDIVLFRFIFPLAISFYTFQQIAYLVDSYRGKTKRESFLDYCLFVTFFPQLIAGPIVRHNQIMPQFIHPEKKKVNYRNMSIGLYIFFIGLFKHVVIADSFSLWANQGFNAVEALTFLEAWTTSLSYTFQLYFDFSAYTDMAIGIAYFFNIKLPFNFNSPYKAVNIQLFWRRWHITLSKFLQDYIYIPLGGNRKSEYKLYRNILITFVIGGIWHGTGWTFFLWGVMHGIAAIIFRLWQKLNIPIPNLLAGFITFNFVNIAWVFFRAKDISNALNVLKGMFGLTLFSGFSVFKCIGTMDSAMGLVIAILSIIGVFFMKNTNTIPERFKLNRLTLFYILIVIFISLLYLNSSVSKEFIYFDF